MTKQERKANQAYGKRAEQLVYVLLSMHGRRVERKGYYDRFDLLIDSKWRCEVKTANPTFDEGSDRPVWRINYHRHGVLKEDYDFYILRLDGVPGFKAAIHLVVPAPVGRMTDVFNLRNLIESAAPLVDNFKKVCSGEWGKII